MAVIFDILTDSPTIVYPNGGEIFTEGSINISWTEPSDIPSSQLVWYEIFITDFYDIAKKPELLQIATIPSGNSSYSYSIQKNLKGTTCRVGIRAVNHEGLRSKISFSATDFTITNEELPSPAVMEPIPGGLYYTYIPFIFEHDGVIGRASQRAYYQIYYSSANQDIDWTLLRSNVMVGSLPINIDTSNFNNDTDYVIKIELVDGNNVSPPTVIRDISINSVNTFLIDTVPPKGGIQVIDNEEYINETNLLLGLESYDITTAVKQVQIQQTDLGSTINAIEGPWIDVSPSLTFDLMGSPLVDGAKLIQARYIDYGDNFISNPEGIKYFRTYKNLDNREVTVIFSDGINLYYAFAGNSLMSQSAQLYKNLELVSALEGDATSLQFYKKVLYVAIKDSENKGILQRVSAGEVESVTSLYSADSVINTMAVFNDTLFLGLENGELLGFKGSSVSVVNDDYVNIRSINYIKTDNSALYIFFENTSEMIVMNVSSSGSYVFTEIDTGN
jgi:hypothetical protein